MAVRMNKKLYLLVLIFCLAAIHCAYSVSASAQIDDKILADGNPPLKQSEMNTMIDFYEWALEKDFTPPQRQRFIELSIASYKENVAESRKAADALFEVFGKVRRLSQDEQQKIREQLKPELIKEFRRENDETSKLLLAVAENPSANNQTEITEEPDENNNEKNNAANKSESEPQNSAESFGRNLSSLSGKWVWGRSGSSTYASGGALLGSNGSRFTYQFSANGAVEYTGIMNMVTAGCRLQAFTAKKGKARLNGDTLTINWSPADFSREDSCSPAKNYKKTLPAETETLRVQFKDSAGQKQLCLTGKNETCFSPEN
jgi:hypothetical protein